MELETLRAKKKTEKQLRERQLELEQEHEEMELRRQKEQKEQELRLKLQQKEDELCLRQHERELENERKKAEADEEQRRMEIELKKGSSGASGSQVDDLERTTGWANSVAQRSGPSRPLSPSVVIDPPKIVTQDRRDKSFSAYPKITPLLQPDAGLFSAQLQDSSILKKPEIPKSISLTDSQTFLPKTTFQQQEPSAFQYRQRSQSPKHNSRNRLKQELG